MVDALSPNEELRRQWRRRLRDLGAAASADILAERNRADNAAATERAAILAMVRERAKRLDPPCSPEERCMLALLDKLATDIEARGADDKP